MGQSTIPVKQLSAVTTLGDPGDDEHIPTEQAVREALNDASGSVARASASINLFLYYNCM